MEKKLKIAFIISDEGLPVPAVFGGAIETLVTLLIEENEKAQKFEFIIVCKYYDELKKYGSIEKYRQTHIYYIDEKTESILTKIKLKVYNHIAWKSDGRLSYLNLFYYRAYKIIRRERVDYAIAEGGDYQKFWLISKKMHAFKTIIHIHHELKSNSKLLKIFGKSIAVSDFIMKKWMEGAELGEHKLYVLKNAVDEKRFEYHLSSQEVIGVREKLGFAISDFVVIYCGRIIKERGVKELIEAFSLLDNTDVKLLILGATGFAVGEKGKYECEVIEKCKADTRIKILGYIDNYKIYQYYQCSDVLVIPSICEEASTLTILEGMYSGIPVIATDSGGLVEYAKDSFSIIVKRDEYLIENIAKAIMKIKGDEKLRNSMKVHALSEAKKYSGRFYFKNFSNLIDRFKEEEL